MFFLLYTGVVTWRQQNSATHTGGLRIALLSATMSTSRCKQYVMVAHNAVLITCSQACWQCIMPRLHALWLQCGVNDFKSSHLYLYNPR